MLGSMIGFLGNAAPGEDKKRAVKPKTSKRGGHKVTGGEKSVTSPGQQHGELGSYQAPTHGQMMKERAKGSMRNATDDWVNGKITTGEHVAIHERAKHVISGKRPDAFRKGR
jgi:hypothetical protein